MGTIQQELFARAADLVERKLSHDGLFKSVWSETLVVLSGSAPTEFADKFSSIDLVAVLDDPAYLRVEEQLHERGLAGDREAFRETTMGEFRFKYAVYRASDVRKWLRDFDDFALGLFWAARPVHDPQGWFEELVGPHLAYPPEIIREKVATRFAELRRRQASMAWNLRRGQPFAFLDNLVRFGTHAFSICFYLEGRPPVGKKWLFRGAMRTEIGRRLRPRFFELFGLLGDLTTLGGTIHVHKSALYTKVAAIQEDLDRAIEDRGFADN